MSQTPDSADTTAYVDFSPEALRRARDKAVKRVREGCEEEARAQAQRDWDAYCVLWRGLDEDMRALEAYENEEEEDGQEELPPS